MEARGGKCIAIQCDHSKDEDIERVFEQIQSEENGCLDILVNNAYSGVKVRRDRGYTTKFPENGMKMSKKISSPESPLPRKFDNVEW